MQPENGGAGFNTKTHHQVDGSNGNSEMREEVGRGGGLFVANTTRCHRLSSLTCTCKSRIFAQQEFDSCWMFLVDRRAYTCHIRNALAHLHVWFNQTCRLFCPFILFPRLQVRIGGFSPHARSLTPAWFLFRRSWAHFLDVQVMSFCRFCMY